MSIEQSVASNLTTVGRFSSQLLAQRGAQKTVRVVGDQFSNTFSQNKGGEVAPQPDSQILGNNNLVTGAVSANMYSAVLAYFQGRGLGETNVKTMTLLTIDTAKFLNVNPITLLENTFPGRVSFSNDAMNTQNILRNPSDQIGVAKDINNRRSLQSRAIRA